MDRICLASDFKLNFWRQNAFFIMSVLLENLNRIFIFKLPETTAFLPFRYLFSTAFLPLFYDIIFDPVCQLSVNHKWMLDKFTENYCIFTVWLLFCSTSPFEIFAMCFFSGPECILKCCSMFARNFDLQSFQKIFNHYWQILNYKKVYLKKEKKKMIIGEKKIVLEMLTLQRIYAGILV